MSDPVVEAAAAELLASGAGAGSSIHGWRCEYPDRYGECDCVQETARDIVTAVRPLIEAEVRAQVAAEIARGE